MATERKDRLLSHIRACGEHLERGLAYLPVAENADVFLCPGFCDVCRLCLNSPWWRHNCRQAIRSGAYQSWLSGEPYYFRCWLGLNSVVVAVGRGRELEGAVVFGGFFYHGSEQEDRQFLDQTLQTLPGPLPGGLTEAVPRISVLTAAQLRGMAHYIYESLFAAGINNPDDVGYRQIRYALQRRVAERLHRYGQQPTRATPERGILDMLGDLVPLLRKGDRGGVMQLLDDFFCRLMLLYQLDLDQAKMEIVLLLTLLMRERLAQKQVQRPLQALAADQALLMNALDDIGDITDLCHWTFLQVDEWLQRSEKPADDGESRAERIQHWLQAHYWRRHVTLEDAARDLGMSVSGIVKALRKDGRHKSFHRLLQDIRVTEAKKLLAGTGLPLSAIASRCGFADQSHFTRVFAREINLTPGRFRKLLTFGQNVPA